MSELINSPDQIKFIGLKEKGGGKLWTESEH